MVRATLREVDPKTQTRRIVKPQPTEHITGGTYNWKGSLPFRNMPIECLLDGCPYGVAGDRLWVRETHSWADVMIDNVEREDAVCVAYKADKTILRHEGSPPLSVDTYAINFEHKSIRWRPSTHMPRWASRITLEITTVRVERVQEISEDDAEAEGIGAGFVMNGGWPDYQNIDKHGHCTLTQDSARMSFATLWDSINGKGSWNANPWIWVIEFERCQASPAQLQSES